MISRSEIARKTNLTKPTVSQVVQNLIRQNIIKTVTVGRSTQRGGRRPILLSFNPDYKYLICLDFGGTKLKAALMNLEGEIISSFDQPTNGINSAEKLCKIACKTIKILSDDHPDILGVGIGIPGTVDSKTGFVHYIPSFNLRNIDLGKMLSEQVKYPVFIGNDVNLNALGELWKGAASGFRHILVVSLGTGTGAALIINEELYEGKRGMAGEIGYQVTDWSLERNIEFRFGRLEYWFSGYSFKQKLADLGKQMTVRELFEYGFDDKELRTLLLQGLEHLGAAIANIICLLDLDAVVISGGIGINQYEKILNVIWPVVQHLVPEEILRDVVFKRAMLGDFGVVMGACYWVQKLTFVI